MAILRPTWSQTDPHASQTPIHSAGRRAFLHIPLSNARGGRGHLLLEGADNPANHGTRVGGAGGGRGRGLVSASLGPACPQGGNGLGARVEPCGWPGPAVRGLLRGGNPPWPAASRDGEGFADPQTPRKGELVASGQTRRGVEKNVLKSGDVELGGSDGAKPFAPAARAGRYFGQTSLNHP